jgi:hypothetical protein
MARANEPADYERLSTLLHAQEEGYRARAQAEMDDYARCERNILVAPKFPTRADQDLRLFQYYSEKADEDARLAQVYDRKLLDLGMKPRQSANVISVKDLQKKTWTTTPVNAALSSTSQSGPDKR